MNKVPYGEVRLAWAREKSHSRTQKYKLAACTHRGQQHEWKVEDLHEFQSFSENMVCALVALMTVYTWAGMDSISLCKSLGSILDQIHLSMCFIYLSTCFSGRDLASGKSDLRSTWWLSQICWCLNRDLEIGQNLEFLEFFNIIQVKMLYIYFLCFKNVKILKKKKYLQFYFPILI